MLTPQTLDRLPDPLVDLINELQTEIIQSIAKKLTKANYLTPSAEWQLYKAQQLRLSTSDVNKLLAKYTRLSKRQIAKIYTDACKQAISNDAKIYRQFGKDASSFTRSVPFSNALKSGIKNANGMFENFTRSTVQSSRKTVTHLMDKAYLKVLSGAFSPQEAIYSAVRELADKGIQSVTYPSGRTDWADVAVRRAVITGIGQTTGRMQLDLAQEMGTDLVEVTSHHGARPSHAEWQGKVYSISGRSKKYPPLSVTGYGRGDGLKGWNCRHDFFPFFEGLSERANFPVDKEENLREYELEQKQRGMERAIRKSKRGLAALDSAVGSTDDEELKAKLQSDFDRKSNTLKRQEARLSDFCESNGLLPRNDRTRVIGFGRSVSQKAVHGSKRYTAKKADTLPKPKPIKAADSKADKEVVKSGRKDTINSAFGIDKSQKNGIIKNIKMPAETSKIRSMSDETKELIQQTLDKLNREYEIHLDEFITAPLGDEDSAVPFQFQPIRGKDGELIKRLVINSKYDFMGTQEAFQERIMRNYNRKVLASNSVEGLISHELAHVMTFQDISTYSGYLLENKRVSKKMVYGISKYADGSNDGAECIAEAFAAKQCGAKLTDEAQALLDEFIERWRKA